MNIFVQRYFCLVNEGMKILYSKHFPPGSFGAINLFGVIIARKGYGKLTDAEINHEYIHTRQMVEMLVIFFYISYLIEWIVRLIQYRNMFDAYVNISYEREAYRNMYNIEYLKKRRPFTFKNYYKKTV